MKSFKSIKNKVNLDNPNFIYVESVEVEPVNDTVNHPSHYNSGKIEVIDIIKDQLSKEGFIGYLRGNITKYLHRYKLKNGVEDLRKAEWYLKKLIEEET